MSVDISQLTAQLDPERRDAVKAQYEEGALNPTAAFLLCFFLGSAGAHRFYLKEGRVGFAHLALFALGAVSLGFGLYQTLPLTTELASHPMGFALDVLGVLLLLAALIWEIIDLGRIDHQVYQRNLLLAEGIIAATLLADQTVVEGARQRLDDAMRQTHAQAQPATVAAGAATGVITANEVADARALAEESGGVSSISYTEVSRFDVSANPDATTQPDAAHVEPWTETTTTSETTPGATPDDAPSTVTETTTHTHSEDGPRVTDSYEVDRVAGPSAAEVAGLGAAGLGAAALGAGLAGAAHTSGFDEPTQPDYADLTTPVEAAPVEAAPVEAPYATEPAYAAEAPYASGFDESTQPDYAAYAAPAAAASEFSGYDFDDADVGDVTDASMPAVVAPVADVAFRNTSPTFVHLPDELDAPEEPSAPLYIAPEESTLETAPYTPEPAAPAYESPAYEPASAEPPAEAYVPPVASVFSGPSEVPAAHTPSWDQPTAVQPEPAPDSARHDTLAEAAGVAGLAGAGALAAEAFAHSHAAESEPAEPVAAEPVEAAPAEPVAAEPVEAAPAEPVAAEPVEAAPAEPVAAEPVAAEPAPAAPEPVKPRKIRVKRAAVLDGKVVGEMVVEGEVLPGETPQEAANRIQAEMGHYTPEQIAQAANLSADEEVELHQRSEESGAEM